MEKLSKKEARKIIFHCQQFDNAKIKGNAKNITLKKIEHMGYIQIDTISVIERAHNHTIWNRNSRYDKSQLEELIKDRTIFEYWSHALSYLPMKDYRYTYYLQNHFKEKYDNRNIKIQNNILNRIKNEGPLMAKDFDLPNTKRGSWGRTPYKRELSLLFLDGTLMIDSRVNFHKVYDLKERVLPDNLDVSFPNYIEYASFLIKRYLRVNGIAKLEEMIYLMPNLKSIVNEELHNLLENKEVEQIFIDGDIYYMLASSFKLLDKPYPKNSLKILSPFDNMVIQRKRLKTLYNFEYTLECYVPKEKRKYGYFVLPIYFKDKFVARMDCSVDRKTKHLTIKHLIFEPRFKNKEKFSIAFNRELDKFMKFNDCLSFNIEKITQNYQTIDLII